MNQPRYPSSVFLALLVALVVACAADPSGWGTPTTPQASPTAEAAIPTVPIGPAGATLDEWALWAEGTQLRGANIYQRRVYPELDGPEFMGPGPVGPPYTQEDFDRLAAFGANVVHISHPGLFTETPPYELDPEIQANLDRLLELIARADLFAVIGFRTGPGRSEFTFMLDEVGDWFDESYLNDEVWRDQAAQDGWVSMWRYTAERYRDVPIVVGYDLMVEPNANDVWLDLWDPEEFYADYGDTLYDWNQLHPRITAAIREVDTDTPILVGGMSYSEVAWLPYLEPSGDPRTVIAVHQYAPHDYTHQWWTGLEISYPGELDTDWDGEAEPFDRAWLEDLLSTVDDFTAVHGGPVAVTEFGVVRWLPGAAEFMADQMELFEQRGMNHALWAWDPSWLPWTQQVDGFNFRHGPDPEHHAEVESSALLDVILANWARNTTRPSTWTGSRAPAVPQLDEVSHWFYFIGAELAPEIVDQIAASTYDMVVLDFIPSEAGNTDYPMAEVVTRLHQAPHPKLVLAYIDIGQAEDYRTYWQEDWRIGDPEWIAGEDPDGWEGNYPVAFWYDEWRDIWLGDDGTLRQILDAGFDGVYLDWVEAYSDEAVIAIAEEDGVDPLEEMVWWVQDIGDAIRESCAHCVVVVQNAGELLSEREHLQAIDAVAQEQIWFDGGADDDPPGDCPLPRTEAHVDTEAYRQSLSPPCRRVFDSDPEGTLHTSSEEYLRHLALARREGLVVFTVDYALDPQNVAWVVETSRALGFAPFVGNRGLDRYVEPVP